MPLKIYVDEDAMSYDLASALRLRGVDLLTPAEAGMMERSDEDQLLFAAIHSRVLYSYNISDFAALHTDFVLNDKEHAGIILAPQQRFSIGEQMRRLLRISTTMSSNDMRNRLEYLGSWQS